LETDRLMRLCRQYDLRFVVIHDRYSIEQEEFDKTTGRSPSIGAEQAASATATSSAGPTTTEATETKAASTSEPTAMDVDAPPPLDAPPAKPAAALPSEVYSVDLSSDAGTKAEVGAPGTSAANPVKLESGAGASASRTVSSSSQYGARKLRKGVEDLKARFYTIQQRLLTSRNSTDPDLKSHPIFKEQYDAAYETERKQQLSRLLGRSRDEETQMAEAVLEVRKLSQEIRKIKKQQRDAHMRLVESQRALSASVPGAIPAPYPVSYGHSLSSVTVPPPTAAPAAAGASAAAAAAPTPGTPAPSKQFPAPKKTPGKMGFKLRFRRRCSAM